MPEMSDIVPSVISQTINFSDYQELNMEHHSPSTDNSVVRSWSPFTGSLKMFLTFSKTLTFYIAYVASTLNVSYQFVIDQQRRELVVYKFDGAEKVEMKNESFGGYYLLKKNLLFIQRKATHWEIGNRDGVVTVEDRSLLKMKFWGISSSSTKPVKLTYWKHIGR